MILKEILSLTETKKLFIENFVQELSEIENIQAIVLGGSNATGRANENSDIDLGLYYYETAPFSIEDISRIVTKYSKNNDSVVVGFYEWGPWVNGGAWIHTEVGKVDILYRNIDQVENIINEAQIGQWENHYEQQPPYGFTSMIYLAECLVCLPLFDPQNIFPRIKTLVASYPQALKKSVINTALWSAEFTLAHVDGFASQKDMYNLLGCFTRSLKSMMEALFALNEMYPISDKYAVQLLSKAEIVPRELEEKVNTILKVEAATLDVNVKTINDLFAEIVALSNHLYQPKFKFRK